MTIYSVRLNETERLNYTASHFGDNFPFRIEPFIYSMARNLSRDYQGGYWHMNELSNGGLFMFPASDTPFHVTCMNGFDKGGTILNYVNMR
jgi:hypothetical protein